MATGEVGGERTAEVVVPSTPEGVRQGRRFAASVTRGWGESDLVEDVALVVSELLSNAVRHGQDGQQPDHTTLRLDLERRLLRGTVYDGGDGRPVARRPSPEEPTGRGMQIVEALVDDWGVVGTDVGKGVWFEIARDRADARR